MKSKRRLPVIAVTLGDPAGIGPEIVSKLFGATRPSRSLALLIGAANLLERGLGRGRRSPSVIRVGDPIPDVPGRIVIMDTGCRERFAQARDSRGGGKHAGRALLVACDLAKADGVQGIVTAPISKKSLNLAGHRFAGHTELFAKFFGAPHCQMVMAYRDFRVVPLTRHIPLRKVGAAITADRIRQGLDVIHAELGRQFGIRAPRIAVAGLNPHAGEDGVLGREELEVIGPAVRAARRRGIDVTGPVPADALFQKALDGTFDAFVAMYHDQGLIPFKMVAKRRGVNVTIGLPVVRTSVDHGVAFDIAGQGVAGVESLQAAYRLAERLVARGRIGSD